MPEPAPPSLAGTAYLLAHLGTDPVGLAVHCPPGSALRQAALTVGRHALLLDDAHRELLDNLTELRNAPPGDDAPPGTVDPARLARISHLAATIATSADRMHARQETLACLVEMFLPPFTQHTTRQAATTAHPTADKQSITSHLGALPMTQRPAPAPPDSRGTGQPRPF